MHRTSWSDQRGAPPAPRLLVARIGNVMVACLLLVTLVPLCIVISAATVLFG